MLSVLPRLKRPAAMGACVSPLVLPFKAVAVHRPLLAACHHCLGYTLMPLEVVFLTSCCAFRMAGAAGFACE